MSAAQLAWSHPSDWYDVWVTRTFQWYETILDFKLPPCSERCTLSSGWFPCIWILRADVSERPVCSIFIPTYLWRRDRQSVPNHRHKKIQMPGNYPEESKRRPETSSVVHPIFRQADKTVRLPPKTRERHTYRRTHFKMSNCCLFSNFLNVFNVWYTIKGTSSLKVCKNT